MRRFGLVCLAFWGIGGAVGLGQPTSGAAEETETGGRTRQRSVLIQRKNVFEFAEAPAIRKLAKDSYEITFASKDYCDVAVAIEDAGGKIVRHVAAGLLGPKAPAPLLKDSLRQSFAWNGKDDWEQYVTDQVGLRLRVSLGLDARWEYMTDCHPDNNNGNISALGADGDGVYVLYGGPGSMIRKYGHDGEYVRTVYPFPVDKVQQHWRDPATAAKYSPRGAHDSTVDDTHGLMYERYPDGAWWPQKANQHTGAWEQFCGVAPGNFGLIVSHGRLVVPSTPYYGLVIFGTDGGPAADLTGTDPTGKLPLWGPRSVPVTNPFRESSLPDYMAASPDGKWIYMTGLTILPDRARPAGGTVLHGVYRVPFAPDPPKFNRRDAFVGEGLFPREEPNGLNDPAGLATDSAGNLYICDRGNRRLSIVNPEGKPVAAVGIDNPQWVAVSPKTGEIYVLTFSSGASRDRSRKFDMVKFSALPAPRLLFRQTFTYRPWRDMDPTVTNMTVDFWAERVRVWLVTGTDELQIHEERDGKLELFKDFTANARQGLGLANVPVLFAGGNDSPWWREGAYLIRSYYDPLRNKVYRDIGQRKAGCGWQARYDAATGKLEAYVRIPFSPENITFDTKGRLYVRTAQTTRHPIARFDPTTMREIPFDYGEVAKPDSGPSVQGAIISPAMFWGAGGDSGIVVNFAGDLFILGRNATHGAGIERSERLMAGMRDWTTLTYTENPDAPAYRPRLYPGRLLGVSNVVFVYDHRGQMKGEDVIGGVTHASRSIGADTAGNIFIVTSNKGIVYGRPYSPHGNRGTLFKFSPRGGRFVSTAAPVPIQRPDRPPDVLGGSHSLLGDAPLWVEGAEWHYPGAGTVSHSGCRCMKLSIAVDYFGRVFVPEADRYSIAVLDNSGLVIHRFGRYGNPESAGPGSPLAIGGDEIAIGTMDDIAVATDQRVFGYDRTNKRMVSIKLFYRAEQRVDVP